MSNIIRHAAANTSALSAFDQMGFGGSTSEILVPRRVADFSVPAESP
jgi:hypothetical protein